MNKKGKWNTCPVCGKEFYTSPSVKRKTCSRKCMSIFFKGKGNPNYGNEWSPEQKTKQSKLIKEKVDENFRFKAGSANRGKKFSREIVERMHKNRTPESYSRVKTDEEKKKIGIKSKEKWTEEYKKKHRKKMESSGKWIPEDKKNDYEFYFKEADWVDKMFDLVENGVLLIEKHGLFNSKNNKKGLVRDHIIGRWFGYKNGVFPEILRHPCNCQLITHSLNVSKGQKGRGGIRLDNEIELEELFCKIKQYKKHWPEQKLVLDLIKDYENGKRWNRQGG